MNMNRTSNKQRYISAPRSPYAPLNSASILGVYLNPGESVKWTYDQQGNIVGYTIIVNKKEDECK